MKQKKLLPLSTGLAISLSAMLTANAHANPFTAELLKTGYDNGTTTSAEKPATGSCATGECGEAHIKKMDEEAAKKAEGSCGADHAKKNDGQCGGNDAKKSDGKCGAGQCGGDDAKKSDGQCGAGQCGGKDTKKTDGSCSAGQCGSDAEKKAKGGDCASKATDGRCGLLGDGQ